MTLYLATRLLVKQHDKRNESAENALLKLAEALTGDANVGREIYQAAQELAQRPGNVEYSRVFRTVMQSYIYRRRVEVVYHPLHGKAFETTLSPYLLEPSAIGYATYVIGHSSVVNALRTYKLERIESAQLTRQEYAIPTDFPGLEYLRSAWNIISGEAVTPVKVRFTPYVAGRVKETRWHPSQEIVDDPDRPGGCIWSAQIADLTDFIPWLRSWGSDAEVIEPEDLRRQMEREVKKMARSYDIEFARTDPLTEKLLRCWGKTKRNNDNIFHPALFHMLDVGNIARVLLGDSSPPYWRQMLARALDTDADTLIDWLPYCVALHDIGKITASFQNQNATQYQRMLAEKFPFGQWRQDLNLHHSYLSAVYLLDEQDPLLTDDWRSLWANVLGGHHGQFHARTQIKQAQTHIMAYEPTEWRNWRAQADKLLQEHLLSDTLPIDTPQNLAVATVVLNGFTILCDWLGSDERFFEPNTDDDLTSYIKLSTENAKNAVSKTGFLHSTCSQAPTTFCELFPNRVPPRPLQTQVDTIPQDVLAGPALIIIEAPTGEGKTEVALALAHRLAQTRGSDAFYYALPTTATSNQMFDRIQTYVQDHLHLPSDVQLIHGQAHLHDDDLHAEPLNNGEQDAQDMVTWFTSKKRAILAPFGVGTIDQAELAALRVKHVSLRLTGLAGKVVILDEVHAYDTYMTTIIQNLLEWLSALGTSVIILSATLPQQQRAALVQAYSATLPEDYQVDAYPCVWIIPRQGTPCLKMPSAYQPDKVLDLRFMHLEHDKDGAKAKAQWLLDVIKNGGCACWITNIVSRAQDVFYWLQELATPGIDLSLLHARFPLEDRESREKDLKRKYGPPDTAFDRPQRGIVVGTQVLEQSLDLDFDVMVSDLAPIDLLLQRAGRLQRHERKRPQDHPSPILWVNTPLDDAQSPNLDIDTLIYAEFILRQTWSTLQDCDGKMTLPLDYRRLVEAVYGSPNQPMSPQLAQAWQNLQEKQSDAIKEARERIIASTTAGQGFCRQMAKFNLEEDETSAAWAAAQTRLGQESVNLIPLEKLDEQTARLIPTQETIRLDRRASSDMQIKLLRRHLRTSRPEIVQTAKRQDTLPTLFTQSPRLRGYYPLWLENGTASFISSDGKRKLDVRLDSDLGLIIKTAQKD